MHARVVADTEGYGARMARTSISTVGWMLRGAAAGAAGTTALNVVTYLDMALRGRPASSTPANTVEKLAERAHLTVPGEGVTRASRLEASVRSPAWSRGSAWEDSSGWRGPPASAPAHC